MKVAPEVELAFGASVQNMEKVNLASPDRSDHKRRIQHRDGTFPTAEVQQERKQAEEERLMAERASTSCCCKPDVWHKDMPTCCHSEGCCHGGVPCTEGHCCECCRFVCSCACKDPRWRWHFFYFLLIVIISSMILHNICKIPFFLL